LPGLGIGFGSVGTETNKSKTFTIKNSSKKGTLTGNIEPLSAPYTVTSVPSLSFNLAPGAKQPVTVEFAPTSLGANKVTLSINSNTPKHPVESVHISGTGAGGKISVPASLTLSSGLHPTKVGALVTKNLTIKNTGLGLLTVTVDESGILPPFTITPVGGTFPLTHLQTQVFSITFTPTAKGAVTAKLGITSNDPNPKHDDVIVTLKGTGSVPKVKAK